MQPVNTTESGCGSLVLFFSHSILNPFLVRLMERSVYEIRLFRGLVAVFALTLAVFDGRLVLENKWRSQ
jgi:hypothetical protein